jgi:ankyrin repeat protein
LFVGHNVNYKDDDDMENTAFSFAAAIGNVEAADILLKKNARLPSIRGRADVTPLYLSVLNAKAGHGILFVCSITTYATRARLDHSVPY